MKPSDFKLLSALPEGYDYEVFPQVNNNYLVVGKKDREIIAFILHNNQLHLQHFEKETSNERTNEHE